MFCGNCTVHRINSWETRKDKEAQRNRENAMGRKKRSNGNVHFQVKMINSEKKRAFLYA